MKSQKIKACLLAAMMAAGWATTVWAQSCEPFNPYSDFKASAETWSMTKYGANTKPSLYTGAMSYSVPIYTYEDPEFKFPVSLEYNFDGYRPSQHSGTVGYGWYLNCGGVITREVRGLPDDDMVYGAQDRLHAGYYWTAHDGYGYVSDTLGMSVPWSIYSNTICTDYPTVEMARDLNPFTQIPIFIPTQFVGGVPTPASTNCYDTAPDIYHFSIPGHGGDFMFMPDGSIRVFNCDLPHGEVKLSFSAPSLCRYGSAPPVCGFTLTTGDGTKYEFGGSTPTIEYSSSWRAHANTNMPFCSATAFRLWRITAPNGRTLVITYSQGKQVAMTAMRYYTPKYSGGTYTEQSDIGKSITTSFFSVPESISVDSTPIFTFTYTSKTHDENASGNFVPTGLSVTPQIMSGYSNAAAQALAAITVTNASGDVVESVSLSQQFATSGTPKMFLSSVSSRAGGRHTFTYDLQRPLPKNDTQATDHWGWWNGKSDVYDMRPYLQNNQSRYSQFTGNLKSSDYTYSKTGALTGITYPTGGFSSICYEGNSFVHALDEEGEIWTQDGSLPAGGVRVHSIENRSSESAPTETRTYSYSGGFLYHMPKYVYVMHVYYNNAFVGTQNVTINTDITGYNQDCDYGLSRDEILGYTRVVETHPDNSFVQTDFFTYDNLADDYMDWPGHFPYYYNAKLGIYSNLDYINDQITTSMMPQIAQPYVDRRNMRGKVSRVLICDASGRTVQTRTYEYGSESVTLRQLWWNDLDKHIASPWTCVSPLLERETVTDVGDDGTGTAVVKEYSYNAKGQLCRSTLWSSTDPGRKSSSYYVYYYETSNSLAGDALPAALYSITLTSSIAGQEYILGGERREYADPRVSVNPKSISQYVCDTPHGASGMAIPVPVGRERVTLIEYNSLYRPVSVALPGGKTVQYFWSGNNIITKTVGSAQTTQYTWKDQTGLTSLTDEAGHLQNFGYDGCGRLSSVSDGAGNSIERYDYNLKNGQ